MSPARLARSAGFRLAIAHAALFAVGDRDPVLDRLLGDLQLRRTRSSPRASGPRATSWRGRRAVRASADVADTINARLVASGEPNLAYLLTDAAGHKLAGNLEPAVLAPGWHGLHRPADGSLGPPRRGRTRSWPRRPRSRRRLLVVGADTHPRRGAAGVDRGRLLLGRADGDAVALAGGLALGLGMSATGRGGEPGGRADHRRRSRRARSPCAARGDEFDRLAAQLNRMLDRIQGLMEACARSPTTSRTTCARRWPACASISSGRATGRAR